MSMKKYGKVDFDEILASSMNRREFMKKSVIFSSSMFVTSTALASQLVNVPSMVKKPLFDPVLANTLDTITLPKGYTWQRLISWGDPLWSTGVAFDMKKKRDAKSQQHAFGDNNDGMDIFSHHGKTILAVNNEYITPLHFHGDKPFNRPNTLDDIQKAQYAMGVSIIEITKNKDGWHLVKDSKYNRKVTALTDIDIVGPARGHALLKTGMDPTGTIAQGTWANCGNGKTPWGTYLTCEENFNHVFSCTDKRFMTKALMRYGIKLNPSAHSWARHDQRFDVTKEPNEPNRVGYIVEIDPLNPESKPRKLTALGRLKHENAEVVIDISNHVVVYMGDDERGEYLYKFVSKNRYKKDGDNSALLEDGTIYVAKFHSAGRGEWLALTPQSTGMNKAEICIHTRLAASKVGATTMDRPEWVASNPKKPEVYCSLTNNKNRGIKPNAGGDETPVGGVNPRKINHYGQVVRWIPKNGEHISDNFTWDLFVLAGNPTQHKNLYAGSPNITADNMFNSPDGMRFDDNGGLWIQTDGNYTNSGDFEGMGNNQMLFANTITGEIQRFLVGPKQSEITGLTWSSDNKTMFVGIQHPGEKGDSHFPDGANSVPRSSVIAISREDGGRMTL